MLLFIVLRNSEVTTLCSQLINRSFSNDFSNDKTIHGSYSLLFDEFNEYRTKSGEFWVRSSCEVNARFMRGDYIL